MAGREFLVRPHRSHRPLAASLDARAFPVSSTADSRIGLAGARVTQCKDQENGVYKAS